jgi:hypothetical protein
VGSSEIEKQLIHVAETEEADNVVSAASFLPINTESFPSLLLFHSIFFPPNSFTRPFFFFLRCLLVRCSISKDNNSKEMWWSHEHVSFDGDISHGMLDLLTKARSGACALLSLEIKKITPPKATQEGGQPSDRGDAVIPTAQTPEIQAVSEEPQLFSATTSGSCGVALFVSRILEASETAKRSDPICIATSEKRSTGVVTHSPELLAFSTAFACWDAHVRFAPEELRGTASLAAGRLCDQTLAALLEEERIEHLATIISDVLHMAPELILRTASVGEDATPSKDSNNADDDCTPLLSGACRRKITEVLGYITSVASETTTTASRQSILWSLALSGLLSRRESGGVILPHCDAIMRALVDAAVASRRFSSSEPFGNRSDLTAASISGFLRGALRSSAVAIAASPSPRDFAEFTKRLLSCLHATTLSSCDERPNLPFALVELEWHSENSCLKAAVSAPASSLRSVFSRVVPDITVSAPSPAKSAAASLPPPSIDSQELLVELLSQPVTFFLSLFRAVGEPMESSIATSQQVVGFGYHNLATGANVPVMAAFLYGGLKEPTMGGSVGSAVLSLAFPREVAAFSAVEQQLFMEMPSELIDVLLAAAAGAVEVYAARSPACCGLVMFFASLLLREQTESAAGSASAVKATMPFFHRLAESMLGPSCCDFSEFLHRQCVVQKHTHMAGVLLPLLQVFGCCCGGSTTDADDTASLMVDVEFPDALFGALVRYLPRPYFLAFGAASKDRRAAMSVEGLLSSACGFLAEIVLRDDAACNRIAEIVVAGLGNLMGGARPMQPAPLPTKTPRTSSASSDTVTVEQDFSTALTIDVTIASMRFVREFCTDASPADSTTTVGEIGKAARKTLLPPARRLESSLRSCAAARGVTLSAAALHIRSAAAMIETLQGPTQAPAQTATHPCPTSAIEAANAVVSPSPEAESVSLKENLQMPAAPKTALPSRAPKASPGDAFAKWFWSYRLRDISTRSTAQLGEEFQSRISRLSIPPRLISIVQHFRKIAQAAGDAQHQPSLGPFLAGCQRAVAVHGVNSALDALVFLRGCVQKPLILRSSLTSADANFCAKVVQSMWECLTLPSATPRKVPASVFEEFVSKDLVKMAVDMAANGTVTQCCCTMRFVRLVVEDVFLPWAQGRSGVPFLSHLPLPDPKAAGTAMRAIVSELSTFAERCLAGNTPIGDRKAFHIISKCHGFLGCLTQPAAQVANAMKARKSVLLAEFNGGLPAGHPIALCDAIKLKGFSGEAVADSLNLFGEKLKVVSTDDRKGGDRKKDDHRGRKRSRSQERRREGNGGPQEPRREEKPAVNTARKDDVTKASLAENKSGAASRGVTHAQGWSSGAKPVPNNSNNNNKNSNNNNSNSSNNNNNNNSNVMNRNDADRRGNGRSSSRDRKRRRSLSRDSRRGGRRHSRGTDRRRERR